MKAQLESYKTQILEITELNTRLREKVDDQIV